MIRIDRRKWLAGLGGLTVFSGLASHVPAWGATFDRNPFSLGVASGDPSPDGFVLWTRLAPRPLDEHGGMPMIAVPVIWEVAEDERFNRIVQSGEAVARPELGHAVHVEVAGLKAHWRYWYRFRLEGGHASRSGQVRTAPLTRAMPDRIRMAVAGCQLLSGGHYTAYRHLSQEPDLDAVFHYGDYIYEGGGGRANLPVITDATGARIDRDHVGGEIYSLDDYRRRYAQYKLDPDLQQAHAAAAFISSFDDHEVDNNWAERYDQDGTPPEVFLLRRYAAMQAWYENMPVRRAQFPRPDGLVMYRGLDFGRLLRMSVMDTRSYRSDQLCVRPGETACRSEDGPDSTMLGPVQEAWLSDSLSTTARWNLIAQQVWVMPLLDQAAEGGLWRQSGEDTWNGYPTARRKLARTISDRGLGNVVIATGDAHIHAVGTVPLRDEEADGPAVATEFMATSISSGGDGTVEPTDNHRKIMAVSPHIRLINRQRGYQAFDITPTEWRTDVKVMDKVQSAEGRLNLLASFIVSPDEPRLHTS